MEGLKIYSISDGYVEYLRKTNPNVYSNKIDERIHTRKYIGIVIKVNHYNYYIPMSSPKDSDYQMAGKSKFIKKSIVPIVRIVVKNSEGKRELKGTLRISHMIPVPDSELELYDLDGEKDLLYKDLVQDQIIFIRKNEQLVRTNAEIMYQQKTERNNQIGYVKSALNYSELENLCDQYSRLISQ